MNNDYGVIKSFSRSNIYLALRKKEIERKASPVVLLGLVFFALWFGQAVMQLATVPVVVNILH